ncbi:hypothetical protein [Nocardioides sp.]|uniref:hypothetical protein n=1 Tax=Nocardioides sp. TaxID=35761 RepID=UPI003512AF9D
MAGRMWWHIGLPKTGTTYLQDVLWSHRDTLDAAGLHVPGRVRREHLWASLEVIGADLADRDPRARGSWPRLVDDAGAALARGRDVVLSHEFGCAASTAQARRALDDLEGLPDAAEVHVVLTARPAAAVLVSGWQEQVKNGAALDLVAAARQDALTFGWRAWDLAGVLERWLSAVPAERLHVVTVPADGSQRPAELWRRFASLVDVADADVSAPPTPANVSLGLVELELLRRISPHLGAFRGRAVDRGRWLRGVLAEEHLRSAAAGGPPAAAALPPDLARDCAARTRRARRLIEDAGVSVVGDLDDLLPSPTQAPRPEPEPVDDAALLDAAGRLVASLLAELRVRDGDREMNG